jgi:transcriptional regulator with XRE-family HTH domain|tara:strand:+ start:113 stop:334 length:222 start_codon:yes stop_codon:yes gene_type:complete
MQEFETQLDLLIYALTLAKIYKKMTHKDVAKKVGIHPNTIGAWIRGVNQPSNHMVTAVVAACGYQVIFTMVDK